MGVVPSAPRVRLRRAAWLLPALLLSGCKLEGEGPVVDAVNLVLETELHTLLGMSALGGALGAALGLVLGVLLYLGIRKLGGYDWEWAHAKRIRGLTCALVVVGSMVAGGAVGLGRGMADGFEVVLRKSQLATEVFPVAGDVGADLIAALYLEMPGLTEPEAGTDVGVAKAERAAKLAAFRAGAFEIDVESLAAHAKRLQAARVGELVKELEDEALAKVPSWRGGTFEKVLDAVLVNLGEALVSYEAKKMGLGRIVRQMRAAIDALPEAAARQGNAKTINRGELSAHVVQFGVVPTLMVPVRSFVKGYQLTAVGIFAGVLLLTVVGFRLAEWLGRRRAAASEPEGPAVEPEGAA